MERNQNSLFVIIPVYNEASTIREVITALMVKGFRYIIVVDDGSTQDIPAAIGDIRVVYICHAVNMGQGAALQTGFDYAVKAGCTMAVTFDADGQHDANDLEALLLPLYRGEADIVLGSRFLQKEDDVPVVRKTILRFARIVNFLFSGLLLSDAHNGLRALNAKALATMQLRENRMAHASEILFTIKQKQLRFKEVPVHIHYTNYSRTKGQSAWDSIKILIDLVLHKLFK